MSEPGTEGAPRPRLSAAELRRRRATTPNSGAGRPADLFNATLNALDNDATASPATPNHPPSPGGHADNSHDTRAGNHQGDGHGGGGEHGGGHHEKKSLWQRRKELPKRITELPKEYAKLLLDRKDISANILTATALACVRAGIVWGTGHNFEPWESMMYGAIAGGIRAGVSEKFRASGAKMGYTRAIIDGLTWGAIGAGVGAIGGQHSIDTSGVSPSWSASFGGSPIENVANKVIRGAEIGAASGAMNRIKETWRKPKDFFKNRTGWQMGIGAVLGGAFAGASGGLGELKESVSPGATPRTITFPIREGGRSINAPTPPIEVPKPGAPTQVEAPKPSVPTRPAIDLAPLPTRAPIDIQNLPSRPGGSLPDNKIIGMNSGDVILGNSNETYSKISPTTGNPEIQLLLPSNAPAMPRFIEAVSQNPPLLRMEPNIYDQFLAEAKKGPNSFLANPDVNDAMTETARGSMPVFEPVANPQMAPLGVDWLSAKGWAEGQIAQEYLFTHPDPRIVEEIKKYIEDNKIVLPGDEDLPAGQRFFDKWAAGQIKDAVFNPEDGKHATLFKIMSERTPTGQRLSKNELLALLGSLKVNNLEVNGNGSAQYGSKFHQNNSDYFKRDAQLQMNPTPLFSKDITELAKKAA